MRLGEMGLLLANSVEVVLRPTEGAPACTLFQLGEFTRLTKLDNDRGKLISGGVGGNAEATQRNE